MAPKMDARVLMSISKFIEKITFSTTKNEMLRRMK